MTGFDQRSLTNSSTLGDHLRKARTQRGISIDQVADALRIRKAYIEAIERSDYTALPSGVFVKNYIRKYAKYLQLGKHTIEELLQEELTVYADNPDIPTLTRHLTKQPLKVFQVVAAVAILLVALSVGIYFLIEISNISQPPDLSINEMSSRVEFDQRFVTVVGKTAPEASVTINGQAVSVTADGSFEQVMTLQTGSNVFKIVAKTKRSKENIQYKQIVVEEQSN